MMDKAKRLPTDHNFWRERRAEADSNRGPSAYQPNALPLGQTGSQALHQIYILFKAQSTGIFKKNIKKLQGPFSSAVQKS